MALVGMVLGSLMPQLSRGQGIAVFAAGALTQQCAAWRRQC